MLTGIQTGVATVKINVGFQKAKNRYIIRSSCV